MPSYLSHLHRHQFQHLPHLQHHHQQPHILIRYMHMHSLSHSCLLCLPQLLTLQHLHARLSLLFLPLHLHQLHDRFLRVHHLHLPLSLSFRLLQHSLRLFFHLNDKQHPNLYKLLQFTLFITSCQFHLCLCLWNNTTS